MLVEWLRVAEVWVGANFLFGHERVGNFSVLRTLGQRYGFRAEKIDPVRYKEFVVSSTRIRRLVAEGRMDEAAALLGHPYTLDGTVVEGRRRGREIGFPTANLHTANELIPPHGVYATTLTVDGIIHAALTNIGVQPHLRRLRPRRPSKPMCCASTVTCTAATCGLVSSSACATSAALTMWMGSRHRLRRTAAVPSGCSRECRSRWSLPRSFFLVLAARFVFNVRCRVHLEPEREPSTENREG